MRKGRMENDLKWNYGIAFGVTPYMMKGYLLTIWLFKQDTIPEKYAPANISRGFIFDIEFALSDKVYAFRLPRIRGRIM